MWGDQTSTFIPDPARTHQRESSMLDTDNFSEARRMDAWGKGIVAPAGQAGKGSAAITPPRRENDGRTHDSRRRSRSRNRRHPRGESGRSKKSRNRAKRRDRKRSRGETRVHTKRSCEESADMVPKRSRADEDNSSASGELSRELRKDLECKRAAQPFRRRDFESTAAIFVIYGYSSICAIRDMVGRGSDPFYRKGNWIRRTSLID